MSRWSERLWDALPRARRLSPSLLSVQELKPDWLTDWHRPSRPRSACASPRLMGSGSRGRARPAVTQPRWERETAPRPSPAVFGLFCSDIYGHPASGQNTDAGGAVLAGLEAGVPGQVPGMGDGE